MPVFGNFIRHWLARRGYRLTRVAVEDPPAVSDYLRAIMARSAPPAFVVCFDNETTLQSEILAVTSEDRVVFSSPVFLTAEANLMLGSDLPPAPPGRFVVVIDVETFSLEILRAKLPWIRKAEVILLRARLGSFWAGELDPGRLAAQMSPMGFHLTDVIGSSQLSELQAANERAILAWEPDAAAGKNTRAARYRANEAFSYLGTSIVQRGDFQLLAGRGGFGFPAGVCNPGAIMEDGSTYLLPRAERTPWPLQKIDEVRFFSSPQPLLLTLGKDLRLAKATELSVEGLPNPGASRAEDFRLFRYRGKVFANHSVMSDPDGRTPGPNPLQLDRLQTRVGISRLELKEPRLTWCGFANIDRPLARIEKNWAMFADGERLFLLYSFSPYVLFVSRNWPSLEFVPFLEAQCQLNFAGDGLPVRNSINPVDYDDRHWLHVVHRVYPGKQYSYWAILIDKESLLPVQATARPLVCGWHSSSATIVYACSVIAGPADIMLFAGLDDSATAVAIIPRTRLDAAWVKIAPPSKKLP